MAGPTTTVRVPTGRWIEPNGVPTTEYFRFITLLFASSGAYTAPATTIQSNITSGVASPRANTLTQILDALIDNVRGDIIVRGATVWQKLVLGTTGKALLSDGTDLSYGLVASLAATVTVTSPAVITSSAGGMTITTNGGDLTLDSSTHILKLGTTAAAAAVPANFVADHRIQIKDGAGTTYYVPVSNTPW